MKTKKHVSVFTALNYSVLTILALSMILPFWHILMYSFSPGANEAKVQFLFMPVGFGLAGYKNAFATNSLLRAYINTINLTVVGSLSSVIFTAMAAYALSKKTLYGYRFFTVFLFITMIFGGGLVPTLYVVKTLRLINTMFALFVPRLISGFYVFLMRNFFISNPVSLEESAKLDGANDMSVFLRIIIPISRPLIATMMLFHAVEYWNTWFDGLIYLSEKETFPLMLVLRNIMYDQDIGIFNPGALPIAKTVQNACVIISTVPILLVYPFLQKYFVKGIMIGAIKS